MSAVLVNQLDYIFFLYGFGFLALGAVCATLGRRRRDDIPWSLLALFGLTHGANEWLEMLRLFLADSPAFRLVRFGALLLSFLCLFEFARRSAGRGRSVPGPWIVAVPLTAIVLAWLTLGVGAANGAARYFLAFGGSLWAWHEFGRFAEGSAPRARTAIIATRWLLLAYGIAAGLIVPASPLGPANVLNYDSFFGTLGIPVQLPRGVIACLLAVSVWRYEQASQPASALEQKRTRFFWVSVAGLTLTLGLGWIFTESLGRIAAADLRRQNDSNLALVAQQLNAVKESAVYGASLLAALACDIAGDDLADAPVRERLDLLVDRFADEVRDAVAYLMDRQGNVITSSNRNESPSFVGSNYASHPYFQEALRGRPAFSMAATFEEPAHYASHPVRNRSGAITGVAVIKRNLASIRDSLSHLEHAAMLTPEGIALVGGQPELAGRAFWPLSEAVRRHVIESRQFEKVNFSPVFDRTLEDGEWIEFNGRRHLVGRMSLGETGGSSLFMLIEEQGEISNRLVGILITLLVVSLILTYFVVLEEQIGTEIQLNEKQGELTRLSEQLRRQATTDPLTGLCNRLHFNLLFRSELDRANRYGGSFSIVMFDVDHFKRINDAFGHAVGDNVLVRVSRTVGSRLRNTDVLARWGGEEFMIILPETDLSGAQQAAEDLRMLIADSGNSSEPAVTVSFGVSAFRRGDNENALLGRVDAALYRAKQNGRNRVEVAA